MPAYDYRCRECDTTFEVRRSLDEPETAVACPDTGSTMRVRQRASPHAVTASRPSGAQRSSVLNVRP